MPSDCLYMVRLSYNIPTGVTLLYCYISLPYLVDILKWLPRPIAYTITIVIRQREYESGICLIHDLICSRVNSTLNSN